MPQQRQGDAGTADVALKPVGPPGAGAAKPAPARQPEIKLAHRDTGAARVDPHLDGAAERQVFLPDGGAGRLHRDQRWPVGEGCPSREVEIDRLRAQGAFRLAREGESRQRTRRRDRQAVHRERSGRPRPAGDAEIQPVPAGQVPDGNIEDGMTEAEARNFGFCELDRGFHRLTS